jgi:hypothetical protein
MVIEADVLAVDPPSVVRPADVGPGLVLQAAVDINGLTLGDDADTGEFSIRARAHVDVGRRVAGLRLRGRNAKRCDGRDGGN